MRIGITFGCFIPLHEGHLSLIDKSLEENDITIIAVCGKSNDRGQDFIPFDCRVELVKNKYLNPENKVIVVRIDDNALGLDGTFTLNNWKVWCNEILRQTNEVLTLTNKPVIDFNKNTVTWYTGEASYKEKIGAIYPNHNIFLADRNEINLSGTMIRENPDLFAEYIDPIFVDYLVKHDLMHRR